MGNDTSRSSESMDHGADQLDTVPSGPPSVSSQADGVLGKLSLKKRRVKKSDLDAVTPPPIPADARSGPSYFGEAIAAPGGMRLPEPTGEVNPTIADVREAAQEYQIPENQQTRFSRGRGNNFERVSSLKAAAASTGPSAPLLSPITRRERGPKRTMARVDGNGLSEEQKKKLLIAIAIVALLIVAGGLLIVL